ncbi:MAG: ATP-dependent sacrificial sulfur transferase LarE [Victivallaceae bacterium]|jgi:uncharacterized protein|nr:ATP-dependent sacrificial sulfur transferase LarE [Victivallaceae bacterium]NLK83167.1 ATP-dependent sacrificial sulfur transferase LarE [Lentisphaerota bacterium]MDD3117162.1 ATP-dependent sacrificial sulfur transferase LarE [Victivallaceae bacterium]MDD3703422.1 ATP-dependent sacrificial sulfur transferase LarE [Victivallaceae bacterium]MDD4318100.1 ATP-dependent sacrificial sulfur transferase LarE [Victivallaceae bacterium]
MNIALEIESKLMTVLKKYERLAIAFSGGVDSTLLAAAAAKALGHDNILLVNIESPFGVQHDVDMVLEWAAASDMPLHRLTIDPLTAEAIAENSPERCYHCKKLLMGAICAAADGYGFEHVADGFNVYDISDYRPGARAADELGIVHPFLEAQMDKEQIRCLSRHYGLANWAAPADACLASRIPYRTRITSKLLEKVRIAEAGLRKLGFKGCRVRCHDERADIELQDEDFKKLPELRSQIADAVAAAGFKKIFIDLRGYRRGTLNEGLDEAQK